MHFEYGTITHYGVGFSDDKANFLIVREISHPYDVLSADLGTLFRDLGCFPFV